MELKLNTSKRIIDLITPDTINKTIVVAAGHKFEISDTLNDKILGVVLFGNYRYPIIWNANGFPLKIKDAPEYYHLRLIEKEMKINYTNPKLKTPLAKYGKLLNGFNNNQLDEPQTKELIKLSSLLINELIKDTQRTKKLSMMDGDLARLQKNN
jgi:hypothetical protein